MARFRRDCSDLVVCWTLGLAVVMILAWTLPAGTSARRRRSNLQCSEQGLESREELANVVFTGTVERVYRSRSFMYRGAVRVKRVLKGDNHLSQNTVIVEGFGDPDICFSDVRERDTRIFMVSQMDNGKLRLNSSLVRLNLHSLDKAIAAVKHLPYKKRPAIEEKPCEKLYCAYGAQCLVDDKTQQAYCRCQESCSEVFAPVCSKDGVTYSSECQLRMASCTHQRRIFVRHQGSCDMKNPCEEKECHFGAECRPMLDGRSAECVCPEKCATYGDSRGSRPVCGSDGMDYPNVCELRRRGCTEMRNIQVKFQGRCDPCDGVECPASQVCQLDENRNPICRCNAVCSDDLQPVCGSDGKTYTNECTLRVEACRARRNLRIVYTGECNTGKVKGPNPCESVHCGIGQECDIDRYGIATCQCPAPCEPVMRPVCGNDGVTHDNECEMRRKGCLHNRMIDVNYRGVCGEEGPCHNHVCKYGGVCILRKGQAACECPTCSEEYQPVCGTDGISYTNECKLRREGCEVKADIKIEYPGLCNGCENKKCDFHAICETDGLGNAKCACPHSCVKFDNAVCGTNGATYQNECELRVDSCKKQQFIAVASKGPCDLCQNVHCKYGATCSNGHCVCPTDCPETYEPVCGNDGNTYTNECDMRRLSCQQGHDLGALFYGECEDVAGSGIESGSGLPSCDEKTTCQFGGACGPNKDGMVVCQCAFECPSVRAPVCGANGQLYDNECRLREAECREQIQIKMVVLNQCEEYQTIACDGEAPLLDLSVGKDYFCGEGQNSKPCPPSSYCHKTPTFAKCCREVALIRSCTETTYGCCPDSKTAAQGPNHGGCPSVCQCNRLGSYGQTCDPVSLQCPCKPGVGGLRCDRCEPGFWGLHKISDGNSGCTPCACNESGSVRDDCEQMTGRCVCRHGIHGMKCDGCPPGTVLGNDGCVDEAQFNAESCQTLTCGYGGSCREMRGRAQCVCDIQCPSEDPQSTVCGSDGNTYGSECQLLQFVCRYKKLISVESEGACPKSVRSDVKPTAGSVRRSTLHKVTEQFESKATRHITFSLPENLFLTTNPTTAAPLEMDMPVEIPAFSGRSYLEFQKLHAYTRLAVEMEFRTFASDGILLYNGQMLTGTGDFVALSVRDGYVEFRYNLGSGPVTIKSAKKLQPGRFHRVVAKRYHRDGMLTLDDQDDVSGRSQGLLKSLDLEQNLYLGFVPTKYHRIFENVGVRIGLVGCIRRLRIGRKEVDLRYPGSKDVLSGSEIAECSQNPCSSLPCQNEGTCVPQNKTLYICFCRPDFTGKNCETAMDPCTSAPCAFGSTCVVLPGVKFLCLCPESWSGLLCQHLNRSHEETPIPNFKGSGYLELPTLKQVGQAFTIELWFLTRSPDGCLLYNGQLINGGKGDFLSINLVDGFVNVRFNLGSGIANMTSAEPVILKKWMSVKVTRLRRKATMQLNDGVMETAESNAPMSELNLDQPLYLGGVPSVSEINRDAGLRLGLDGAIQRLMVNGEVRENLLRTAQSAHQVEEYRGPPCSDNPCRNGGICSPRLNDFVCRCSSKWTGKSCEQGMEENSIDRAVAFDGASFLSFPNKIFSKSEGQRDNRFSLRFKTDKSDGLLLWINKGATTKGDYLSLAVSNGFLELSYNLGRQKELLIVRSQMRVDDNKWHTAVINRNKRLATLTLDSFNPQSVTSEPGATELNTDGILWIGGSSGLPSGLPAQYYRGFSGCLSDVSVDDIRLPLRMHGHGHLSVCF